MSVSAWPTAHLASVSTRIGSGITPRGGAAVYHTTGRPFVRSQNVGWGNLRLRDLAFIDEVTHAGFRASEIRSGDVLLNITGASIGRSAVAIRLLDGGNVNQHVCEIRLDEKKMDPSFVCAFLLSREGQSQIDSFQAGGNRQGLNFQQIGSIEIPVPTLAEQQAAGAALSDADELALSLERLISKKQAIKQGMMQQLLTGKTRLPGFSGSWSRKQLGALGTFFKGRGIKRDDVQLNGVPCIRYGELYTTYHSYTSTTVSFVSQRVAASALPIRRGDLLFTGSGETRDEIGMCVAYIGDGQAVAGGDIVVLRGTAFNPVFLSCASNTLSAADQKARLGQGDAVVHISSRALATIEVDTPPMDEQDAIAAVIMDADLELQVLRQRVAKARAIKQGMMQELLTGRTRLPSRGLAV